MREAVAAPDAFVLCLATLATRSSRGFLTGSVVV